MARIVRVPMSFSILFELITEGSISIAGSERFFRAHCVKGVPSSARFVQSYTDSARRIAYFMFEDDSFDEVPPGEEPPILDIQFLRDRTFTPFDGLTVELADNDTVIIRHDRRYVEAQMVQNVDAHGVYDHRSEYTPKELDLRDDLKRIRSRQPNLVTVKHKRKTA